ncbi:MAG: D-glycero-beta-D-manno-heptose 1,7-bisphosphate 7-phosphatase [Nitrosomonas sp.]|nr:D-glycero-beta-D-manno-heptose 1,7-bisphosphate 7-phosphatase [Nitrosomonas sp.]MDP1951161.1 D-glycero-beta-D-manno-heptose 1,7-bisphosphate 7-phosphatase [Nitrosomonas sp.]
MKLIILDDNGVINFSNNIFIKIPNEWNPIPGSLEAIAQLCQNGYRVLIVTNQSAIGRGLIDMEAFNAINEKMYKAVSQAGGRIDALFFCPHAEADKCNCRKPATGMFEEIMRRYGIDLKGVPVIGDSLRDLQAAAKMDALPVLVLTGKGEKTKAEEILPEGTEVFADLAAVVDSLIGKT